MIVLNNLIDKFINNDDAIIDILLICESMEINIDQIYELDYFLIKYNIELSENQADEIIDTCQSGNYKIIFKLRGF